MKRILFLLTLTLFACNRDNSEQNHLPLNYNPVWYSQSENSSQSMPCGGGDIGLNVWVEEGDLLFYFSRSGTFDENNEFLKLGRVRVQLDPNPLSGEDFRQELILEDGYIRIQGKDNDLSTDIKIWADVFIPCIHLDMNTSLETKMKVSYENWRYENKEIRRNESFANSYKWAPPAFLKKYKDSIRFSDEGILFIHKNKEETVFDVTVEQQGMESVKDQLFNPLKNLAFGGLIIGEGLKPAGTGQGKYLDTEFRSWILESTSETKQHKLEVHLHTDSLQDFDLWTTAMLTQAKSDQKTDTHEASVQWWNDFWQRSFIVIEPDNIDSASESWQVGRNYQLFRYMLACNAYGTYPSKFNGGLFTYDPRFTDSARSFTPDFRNWGGGTFTAQNQRLVYFPMLKSGDFDMMAAQLDFYTRIQENAELRTRVYWGHKGACFTEQIENFGLPNPSEYGWNRPIDYDRGLQYNDWLEYQWDTSLEICLMMLEQYYYQGSDISNYIPFILSCLTFFDEHYQYLALERGEKELDEKGHLVLYPGSSCETYKMTDNATPTIAGLSVLVEKLLGLPGEYLDGTEREYLSGLKLRIPPIEFRSIDGHATISPAKQWERVNNTEAPQLYPVFPWGIYGIGLPGLDTAINTYMYDPDVIEFRDHISWKQYNIFAARLGMTEEAWHYTSLKLKNSGRRFPAFWGPGFDWVPDHNWGGSGMIGLQEMLLQCSGDSIYLFPAWPQEIDVHFKLHAPGNTTVEAALVDGLVSVINMIPESRKKVLVIMNELSQQK